MAYICEHGHSEYDTLTPCPECEKLKLALEEEKSRLEYAAKMRKQREAEEKVRKPIYDAIINALLILDKNCKANYSEGYLYIHNIRVYNLDINEDMKKTCSWRYVPTGKLSVVVGDYGSRKRFPQRKDGTHNYQEIAEILLSNVNSRISRETADNIQKKNEAVVNKFIEICPIINRYSSPMSVRATSNSNKPLEVQVKFTKQMTFEEAQNLLTKLIDAGLITGED